MPKNATERAEIQKVTQCTGQVPGSLRCTLDTLTSVTGPNKVWIGITDLNKEGRWEYEGLKPYTEKTGLGKTPDQWYQENWSENEPNRDDRGRNCAIAVTGHPSNKGSELLKWKSYRCGDSAAVVCQKTDGSYFKPIRVTVDTNVDTNAKWCEDMKIYEAMNPTCNESPTIETPKPQGELILYFLQESQIQLITVRRKKQVGRKKLSVNYFATPQITNLFSVYNVSNLSAMI